MENKNEITSGPDKFKLMLSLFNGERIMFTIIKDGETKNIEAIVHSGERKTGNYISWDLKINIVPSGIPYILVGKLCKVSSYNTDTKKGFLEEI